MEFQSHLKRPCFVSSRCGTHGVILFDDGTSSSVIRSIQEGKEVVKRLLTAGQVSRDDADRIEDHLVSSDLPVFNKEEEPVSSSLIILSLRIMRAIGTKISGADHHRHQCSKCGTQWEHDGLECAGSAEAHTCPKCGNVEWVRLRE